MTPSNSRADLRKAVYDIWQRLNRLVKNTVQKRAVLKTPEKSLFLFNFLFFF